VPIPVPAFVAAGLFAGACAMLAVLQQHPYPTGAVAYWARGTLAVCAGAIVVALLPMGWVRALPARCVALLQRPSPAAFGTMVAVVAISLSIGFAFYAFARLPRTSDEVAQLWHAKMILHGRLSLPVDKNPEFFAMDNVVDIGKWYSEYPIGGPLVMATGLLIGAPWLVNPVLTGIAAAAMYHFARHAYGETQGRAIAALFAITPMILLMSGSYMNHVPVLCLAACTLALLAEWDRAAAGRRRMLFAALVGVALGAMATIRPLDALVMAAVVGVFQLSVVWHDRPRMRELLVQAAGGVLGVAPLLYANLATTGGALRFGYDVLWGAGHNIGFHTDPHGTAHTLHRGLEYAVSYVNELNLYLLLWPVPTLLLMVIGLLAMRKFTRWDALLLGMFWVQVAAYASYWYNGQFLGPRFLFTVLPALVVVVARTPFLVGDRYGAYWRRAALLAVLGCIAISWTTPGSPFSVWGMANDVRNTRRVLKVDVASMVAAANIHHALVFLREPVGSQIQHRLWGLGMSRSDAAQLLARSDACSLFDALRAVENDSSIAPDGKPAAVTRAAAPFVAGSANLHAADPTVHITSAASLSPACHTEFDNDAKIGVATFGSALFLEPINAAGHIDGDIIYVMDLGERNALLKVRFGDRTWYRLSAMRPNDPEPTLRPYELR
jgi:4-amino-4-deoxy-L-arabinose transferase-like glycosyltransferase